MKIYVLIIFLLLYRFGFNQSCLTYHEKFLNENCINCDKAAMDSLLILNMVENDTLIEKEYNEIISLIKRNQNHLTKKETRHLLFLIKLSDKKWSDLIKNGSKLYSKSSEFGTLESYNYGIMYLMLSNQYLCYLKCFREVMFGG